MRYLLLNGEMKKHARQTACEQHGNNAHQRGNVQALRDRNIPGRPFDRAKVPPRLPQDRGVLILIFRTVKRTI
jgi:hypothetical protein